MNKKKITNKLCENALFSLEVLDSSDEEIDEIMDELVEDLHTVYKYRYAYRTYVPKNANWFEETLVNLDDYRFKQMLRVSRKQFDIILELIIDNEVFHGVNSKLQFSPFFQLALVLYRLGSCGENASKAKIATLFGVGDGGTLQKITKRVFKSIIDLNKIFLCWPNAEERKDLVCDTMDELPYCIGYLDGTEIPLDEAPVQDPVSYFSRSKQYSIKLQAICDSKLRIRNIVIGYPGSVHDSRIFNNSVIGKNPKQFLTEEEWIAADSAYRLTPYTITPFRKSSRALTSADRKKFNTHFSKYRVRIEHCFGILKEKFPSLKKLKINIFNESSHKFACFWIRVCCILYNIILPHLTEDDFKLGIEAETELDEVENADNINLDKLGEIKRIAIYETIFQHEL